LLSIPINLLPQKLILTIRSTASFSPLHKSIISIKMSARLDKSLDEIISTRRVSRGGKGRRHVNRNGVAGKPAPTPVGGVKKNAKPAKGSVKTVPTGPSGGREGRILVSGFVSCTRFVCHCIVANTP
jgi:hypothetical protein